MKREHFVKVVEEALDSLPQEFRSRIRNVAVLVEDMPPNQPSSQSGQQERLLLGLFHGVPTTKKSIFDLTTGPDYIIIHPEIVAKFMDDRQADLFADSGLAGADRFNILLIKQ